MAGNPIIIPVASGKGGVGKTFVSVNLSYALASLAHKTILIDMDFGGANVHTVMGYDHAPDGIGNFINRPKANLADYALSTNNPYLSFIPGDAEMVGMSNLTAAQKRKMINAIRGLEAEYIVLDLGAGSAYNTIDFYMLSSIGVIVATPELTSILNAYAMLKNSIFRLLFTEMKKYPQTKQFMTSIMKQGGESAWKVSDILNGLFRIDPDIEADAAAMLSSFNPKLIINMAYKPKDLTSGEKLRKITKNYLNIEMEYLGFLYRDQAVENSIAQRHPLAVLDPNNATYQTVIRMAYKIASARKLPYFVLDIDNYEDSYEAIMDEATDDLSARLEGYSELANEELLSVNELLSSIKNLEYENIELRKKIAELEKKVIMKR